MSELHGPRFDWAKWLGVALLVLGTWAGIVTTWAVLGERVDVLYWHRDRLDERITRVERDDELKKMIVDLKVQSAQQTTQIEALEKRIVERTAQRRR